MNRSDRRVFLKKTATCGIASTFAISGTKSSGQVIGANQRVRVAIAGINGRGIVHINTLGSLENVQITHLVDPDSRLFASRSALVQQRTGYKPVCQQDIRRVLEDGSVDAVTIATPNHWHALMTIWACQAGKDVYVEKPCSHNIVEGRRMVDAAARYGRIVQHGTQWRSDPKWRNYTADIRNGNYGKLQTANIQIFRPRKSIGIATAGRPPQQLDYDLWTGPAAMVPYRTNLVHYRWHWMWNFGDGEIGNLGAHEFEMARWAMPAAASPKSVVSLGGRYGYEDQAETPNTQITLYDFGDVKLISQQRGLHFGKQIKMSIDFHTDQGVIREGKFYTKDNPAGEPILDAPASGLPENGGRAHFQNFIDCVRNRQSDQLASDILDGHQTAVLAHLGNISYRLGNPTSFSQTPEDFADSAIAGRSFESMKQHLVDAADLRLDRSVYRLGPKLQFDANKEQFVGSARANKMLVNSYRTGFQLPSV